MKNKQIISGLLIFYNLLQTSSHFETFTSRVFWSIPLKCFEKKKKERKKKKRFITVYPCCCRAWISRTRDKDHSDS